MKYRRCDNTITNPMRITKITTGCGTLLPTRSTPSSSRYVNDLGAPVASLMEPPFVSRGKYTIDRWSSTRNSDPPVLTAPWNSVTVYSLAVSNAARYV